MKNWNILFYRIGEFLTLINFQFRQIIWKFIDIILVLRNEFNILRLQDNSSDKPQNPTNLELFLSDRMSLFQWHF